VLGADVLASPGTRGAGGGVSMDAGKPDISPLSGLLEVDVLTSLGRSGSAPASCELRLSSPNIHFPPS
jgi:hypothetical protein